jgi:hypothetical protein
VKAVQIPALVAALLFVLGPLAAHFGLVPSQVGFIAFVASLVPALIALVIALKLVSGRHYKAALPSLIVGLGIPGVILSGVLGARGVPPINDISTNLDNVPALTAATAAPENAGKDLAYPEAYVPVVRRAYPDLISLQIPSPAPDAYAAALAVARGHPTRRITRDDPDALTFEGEETSALFRFTDDFVVRVLPLEQSAQVDMRSRSRLGQGDFGVNAKRIRRFFALLQAHAGAPPTAAEPQP